MTQRGSQWNTVVFNIGTKTRCIIQFVHESLHGVHILLGYQFQNTGPQRMIHFESLFHPRASFQSRESKSPASHQQCHQACAKDCPFSLFLFLFVLALILKEVLPDAATALLSLFTSTPFVVMLIPKFLFAVEWFWQHFLGNIMTAQRSECRRFSSGLIRTSRIVHRKTGDLPAYSFLVIRSLLAQVHAEVILLLNLMACGDFAHLYDDAGEEEVGSVCSNTKLWAVERNGAWVVKFVVRLVKHYLSYKSFFVFNLMSYKVSNI